MANAKKTTMDELLANPNNNIQKAYTGETVTGKIISIKKHEILIDLGAKGVGMVPRRESVFLKNIKQGDEVTASVIDSEMDDGMILLSMRKAAKDKGWSEAIAKQSTEESVEIIPYDVNRGGLLAEYEGIRGFLPVSQLSTEHYPRVNPSDKDEIIQRLNALVNQKIKVRIIDADKRNNKLIFSEKEAIKGNLSERFSQLQPGDTVEGKVTGVVDFGVFVNVDGIEGLVHISEISWERVVNPADYVKVGENVKAKIIAIDHDRLSLSMKQLEEDPRVSEVTKLKIGDKVEGTVVRITPFGAFIQITPAVEGLVHVSELSGSDSIDPEKIFTLNERKDFTVINIDSENRKVSLSVIEK